MSCIVEMWSDMQHQTEPALLNACRLILTQGAIDNGQPLLTSAEWHDLYWFNQEKECV